MAWSTQHKSNGFLKFRIHWYCRVLIRKENISHESLSEFVVNMEQTIDPIWQEKSWIPVPMLLPIHEQNTGRIIMGGKEEENLTLASSLQWQIIEKGATSEWWLLLVNILLAQKCVTVLIWRWLILYTDKSNFLMNTYSCRRWICTDI